MLKSIRIFLISSLISLFFLGCQTAKKNHIQTVFTNQYFNNPTKEYLYAAKINAFGNDLSGIFVFKNLDKNHYRMALLSDFGNTLFDFEFLDNKFTVNYAIEDLNRKIITKRLGKYLKLIVNAPYIINDTFDENTTWIIPSKLDKDKVFLYHNETMGLYKISQGKTPENAQLEVQYFGNKTTTDSIHFKAYSLPIDIKLYKKANSAQ